MKNRDRFAVTLLCTRDLPQWRAHMHTNSYHASCLFAELVKRASLMEDEQMELMWRWEVKKPSCLSDRKESALDVRKWLKAVRTYALEDKITISKPGPLRRYL
jgi:hypothetical protein